MSDELPNGFIIDVCATCFAHAVWPFICGHKPTRFTTDQRPWTISIHVAPTKGAVTRMTKVAGGGDPYVYRSPAGGETGGMRGEEAPTGRITPDNHGHGATPEP